MKNDNNFEFPIVALNRTDFDSVMKWVNKYKTDTPASSGVYIYGAGIRGNMMLVILQKEEVVIKGFIDSSEKKIGGTVGKYEILSLDDVLEKEGNDVRILVSPENFHDIEDILIKKGLDKGTNFWVIKNEIYDRYIEDYKSAVEVDYLAFGDCFFTDLDVEGLDDRTIGEALTDSMGGNGNIRVLSLHGMCIPGFYHLMRVLLKKGATPKAVAFIVNIPFCNSIQTKLPQSQHYELFQMIKESCELNDLIFDKYVETTKQRSKNINGEAFSSKNKRDSDHVEKMLTKARYMYELKDDNENIEYMRKMIELLKEHGIRPIPFIPSLNYYVACDWFADEFLEKYDAICDKIANIVSEYSIDVLNMSRLLKQEHYIGQHMTKFPNTEGIRIEADRIKAALTEE